MAKTLFGDEAETEAGGVGTTLFGDVAENAVALLEPTEQKPLEPEVAFDRAGRTWDSSVKEQIPLTATGKALETIEGNTKKKQTVGVGLGPLWDLDEKPITMRERLGLEPTETIPINIGGILKEIPKGVARFLQRDLAGTFGGTVVDWLGQFIELGGKAVDDFTKLGSKDKDRIYNPLAESIMALGEKISLHGKESRAIWANAAATGWEAMDENLKETDPISYGAGRLSEGVGSSALSVLAVYLSGGASAAPQAINAGIQINRGLLALSTLSAAGGFEHAQNEGENFLWATLHGLADGAVEYAMETAFLKGIQTKGRLAVGVKEGTEEFFTGMMQNTRAGILEGTNQGLSAYEASKAAFISSLRQSPWEVAAGFIGGYGIAAGADLVSLTQKGITGPTTEAVKQAEAAKAPEKAATTGTGAEIIAPEAVAKPEKPAKPLTEQEVTAEVQKAAELPQIDRAELPSDVEIKVEKFSAKEASPEGAPFALPARPATQRLSIASDNMSREQIQNLESQGFVKMSRENRWVSPEIPQAPAAAVTEGEVSVELLTARGTRAAADIGGVQAVGAKNLKEANKILEKAGERPVSRKVKKITVDFLEDLYSNKKPPVIGDSFTDSKGFRIEVTAISKTPTGTTEIDYQTFPKKGIGRTRSIFVDKVFQAQVVAVTEGKAEPKRVISKSAYEKARKRLIDPTTLRAGIDPQSFADLVIVGAFHFETGVRNFAEWSAKMIEELGESIKPHLKKVWNDVNAQQIPTKQEQERLRKQRGFVKTIKGALPELKVEGTYIPRSTDELSIKARNLVKEDIKQAEQVALKGNSDKSVAVASELLKHYSEQAALASDQTVKDALYDKAGNVASDIAAKLTESGRAVQAAIILTRLTPEGQLRFAAREIQKYNDKIEKSKGGLFGLKKKIPELTPKQTEEILTEMKAIEEMPPGTEKARRFQKLQNKISDMVPTSLFQKMIAVWKAGLLTGIKTTGLNITANISHVATETLAKIPAVMLDKIVSIGTGKRSVAFTMKGLPKGAVIGVKRGVDYLVTGYDERDIGTKLDYKRKSFGKGKTARALQAYTDGVFRLLGAEDQPFYYATKLRSLYEQAKVSAINAGLRGKKAQSHIDNLMESPTEDMIKNASKDAESAVFQNKTSLGDLAKGIQGLAKGAGEIVVPFGRTPSAVAMQIINYSPVGAVKTIIENIGKGKFNQRDFVTGLGRSIVGAIPLVIGAALWDNDMLTLDFPKTEKERKLWDIEGRKANSVKVDGKWRTIQSFGPAGNLLVVGGHFRRAFLESGSPSEAMVQALAGSAKSFTEQTFLQGINQFSAALNDPERSGPRLARGLVSSVIPTIVGDIARATDPLERRTGSVAGRVKAKIPGLRQTLEPRITVLGEEKKASANPLEIMIDPTRPSKEINTVVVKELRRLFDAGFRVTPSLLGNKEGFELLTPKENTELWKRAGQLIKESLNSIFSEPSYKTWMDEAKAEVINRVVAISKDAAKAEAVVNQLKGLKGKDLTGKLIILSESGLMTSELIPKKVLQQLKAK